MFKQNQPALPALRSKLRSVNMWLSDAPFGLQLMMISTVILAVVFYYFVAAFSFDNMTKEIADGSFYPRTDFNAAIWQAGLSLRSGDIAGLYQDRWLYPPSMAPVAALMSVFSLKISFWLWRAGSLLLAAWALRRAGLSRWIILAGLLGPTEVYDVMLGQNGAFTSGIFVSALLLMETRPRFAGGLAGLLCVKPQIALLFPIILLQRKYWNALAFCALTVLVTCVLGTMVAGWRSWLLFVLVAQPTAHGQLIRPFGEAYQLADFTVFMALRSLGLGLKFAFFVQGFCSVAAALTAWRVWRLNDADPVIRMAVTVSLWMLAVPFGFTYDLVCFSIAVAAVASRVPQRHWPVLVLLWLWPGASRIMTAESHIVLIPLAAMICLCISWPALRLPRA